MTIISLCGGEDLGHEDTFINCSRCLGRKEITYNEQINYLEQISQHIMLILLVCDKCYN